VLFLALMLGTLVSEDLACISAGLLMREGRIGFVPGVAACALGILTGDVGLWCIGRASRRALGRWPAVSRRIQRLPLDDMRQWLEEHAAGAMIASRFIPGTRLPLYFCAGLTGMPLGSFTAWASIAVLLWTPALVWLSAGAGAATLNVLPSSGGAGWISRIAIAAAMFVVLKTARPLVSSLRSRAPSRGRRFGAARRSLGEGGALSARLARWSRWEFWPMWLFYAPVAIWVGLLALRHRGIATITASNPGIPDGGVVGESKFGILSKLPSDCTIPSAFVEAGPAAHRVDSIVAHMREQGWSFPLVLKPDVGQRGVGVRLAQCVEDLETYCERETSAILVQPYHAGPFEAGIFYYRRPGEARGRIFSITDKHFPVLIGDGRSTVEALIWTHPRYRLQASTFLTRHSHSLDRVLAAGQRMQLTMAGNHAQGTLFRDGAHLWTPALERRIDEIAQSYPGFFVGRFDVRYSDIDSLRAGHGLAIVELNGATAESTDIYDPNRSLLSAYRRLFTQWSIVFAIGAANRAMGTAVTPTRRLASLLRAHMSAKPAFALSD
jgi:membrane protein DedA with SNARE-associated domain